ncbi:hypothetical protein ACJA88_008556 [Fusarium oxysporum]
MSTTTMRPRVFAYAKFNIDALISLATIFEANHALSPRGGSSAIITEESASKLLISEAATLKYLRTLGSIPVPEVFSFSGNADSDIGVPYILMSKANGRPLSEYDWIELSRIEGYPTRRSLLRLTDQDREKVMKQLGAIMSRLSDVISTRSDHCWKTVMATLSLVNASAPLSFGNTEMS